MQARHRCHHGESSFGDGSESSQSQLRHLGRLACDSEGRPVDSDCVMFIYYSFAFGGLR